MDDLQRNCGIGKCPLSHTTMEGVSIIQEGPFSSVGQTDRWDCRSSMVRPEEIYDGGK